MRVITTSLAVLFLLNACASAQPTQPAGNLPFLQVDVKSREIKVECEALDCRNPLEFFLCLAETSEHEAVLRSKAKPSHLHAALLMIGLKPGETVKFSETKRAWMPPHGPPLQIMARFERDGKQIDVPAYRLMRDIKSKREMPVMTWIFAGSRVLESGEYVADRTGQVISVVNFEGSVIDIPRLASNANESLVWEGNPDVVPAPRTKVTLVITPAGGDAAPVAQGEQAAPAAAPIDQPLIEIDQAGAIKLDRADVTSIDALIEQLKARGASAKSVRVAVANSIEDNPTARDVINALSRAQIKFLTVPQAQVRAAATAQPAPGADEAMIAKLREQWKQKVSPHGQALRDAARTHYDVIRQLRAEQQRLIDEADKIQRLIDELEKSYQDMTTPQPPAE